MFFSFRIPQNLVYSHVLIQRTYIKLHNNGFSFTRKFTQPYCNCPIVFWTSLDFLKVAKVLSFRNIKTSYQRKRGGRYVIAWMQYFLFYRIFKLFSIICGISNYQIQIHLGLCKNKKVKSFGSHKFNVSRIINVKTETHKKYSRYFS